MEITYSTRKAGSCTIVFGQYKPAYNVSSLTRAMVKLGIHILLYNVRFQQEICVQIVHHSPCCCRSALSVAQNQMVSTQSNRIPCIDEGGSQVLLLWVRATENCEKRQTYSVMDSITVLLESLANFRHGLDRDDAFDSKIGRIALTLLVHGLSMNLFD